MDQQVTARVVKRVHVSHAAYSTGQLCGSGGCPAIFETDRGSYFVVGRKLSAEEKAQLPMDGIEDVLEVPRELLREAAPKLVD